MADGGLTKYGFPPGYRFVPKSEELLFLLSSVVDGYQLRPPLQSIFHSVPILEFHPEQLYEKYKDDKEHRYIYFFSRREFQKPGAGVAVPEDKDQKEPRPVRVARGGGWKPSGGGQVLRFPRKMGGFVAGRMVTMVFYHRVAGGNPVKSNWGMHEFTVPVNKKMTSLPTKYTRFNDLALYRLYILKSGDMEGENGAGGSIQMPLVNAHDHFSPSTSVSPCLQIPPWGIFTGMAAGASTSQAPPPLPQHPSAGHAQYYHRPHAFGAPAARAAAQAQQQAHVMPVDGAGLPGNSYQFTSPPPPAAASPAAHQAPATAAHGAGQEAGNFVSTATLSPPPPPAAASPAAELDATAATEPEHAPLADCVKPMEEEEETPPPPPPPEDIAPAFEYEGMAVADGYGGLDMPDWNPGLTHIDDDCFQYTFTFDDFLFSEPLVMEGESNNSGGENYNQGAGTQEDPSAALISH